MACLEHSNVEHRVGVLEVNCVAMEKRMASLEGIKLMAIGACFAWGPVCALLAFLYRHPQAVAGIQTVVGASHP